MTDQEKAFLRAIILSHEPRVEAKMYTDWLDEELRAKAAAAWRKRQRPKSRALQSLLDDKRVWLIEHPAEAHRYRDTKAAVWRTRQLLQAGIRQKLLLLAGRRRTDQEVAWGLSIAGLWLCVVGWEGQDQDWRDNKPERWLQA